MLSSEAERLFFFVRFRFKMNQTNQRRKGNTQVPWKMPEKDRINKLKQQIATNSYDCCCCCCCFFVNKNVRLFLVIFFCGASLCEREKKTRNIDCDWESVLPEQPLHKMQKKKKTTRNKSNWCNNMLTNPFELAHHSRKMFTFTSEWCQ